ncbi:CPBP family intramembrane metalloprotease [Candidatus Thorarchaeota archaeon]|nr:MAG: CPBP family intramembrane metalloprotease [Candidatus Thorarchaeota archaeon]
MSRALRTDTGEIRFIWKLGITLILILVLIIISRFSLIFTVQQILILQGTPSSAAFQNAQIFVAESAEGQTIASSLDFLLMFLLVIALITRFDKHEFHLANIGLDMQRNTLPFVLLGLVIGCGLFLGSVMFGVLFGSVEFPILSNLDQWAVLSILISSIIFYVLNSFWQEIVFRGYLQNRAVEQYGQMFGIVGITTIFVIFHGLVQSLSLVGIISGMLLFIFIGLLYDKTKSLYFVGVIHAVLNFLPVLFDISWQGLEAVVTYGIALLLLILVIYKTENGTSTRIFSNPPNPPIPT